MSSCGIALLPSFSKISTVMGVRGWGAAEILTFMYGYLKGVIRTILNVSETSPLDVK
jgi:hypothetical protein